MTARCESCDHDTQVHADDGSGCLFEVKQVAHLDDRICRCTFNAYKPPPCNEHEGATGITCELPTGHEGTHEGTHTPRVDGTDSVGYGLFLRWPVGGAR